MRGTHAMTQEVMMMLHEAKRQSMAWDGSATVLLPSSLPVKHVLIPATEAWLPQSSRESWYPKTPVRGWVAVAEPWRDIPR